MLEATCQSQATAIQLLEEQKVDITEALQNAKQELEAATDHSELVVKLNKLSEENSTLEEKLQQLMEQKAETELKLTRYMNENMELHETIDKLSKGSSAESIEMVNLTPQDAAEYQKAIGGSKDLADEIDPQISQELNDSLRNLREESSELMSKIELFTIERREVLDKLDAITIENQVLVSSIESLREEKIALEHENESLQENQRRTEQLISDLQTDKEELSKTVSELTDHRCKLQQEINKLSGEVSESSPQVLSQASLKYKEREIVPAVDKEECEKLLKQLDTEIQNLNKNKDKHQKLKISKKLSDNAKNVHTLMTSLLVDYYRNLDECKYLRDDIDKVKDLLENISKGDNNDEEMHKLQQKLQETERLLLARNDDCDAMQVISLFFAGYIY